LSLKWWIKLLHWHFFTWRTGGDSNTNEWDWVGWIHPDNYNMFRHKRTRRLIFVTGWGCRMNDKHYFEDYMELDLVG